MKDYAQKKTFSFKDEILICEIHSQKISYYCSCKKTLCNNCLSEGSHTTIHPNYRIIPAKEIKRIYINELDELENMYSDLVTLSNKNLSNNHLDKIEEQEENNKLTIIDEFNRDFLLSIKNTTDKYFDFYFKDENEKLNEIRNYLNKIKNISESSKILDYNQTLDLINNLRELKQKSKFSIIKKIEKINSVQNIFSNKNEELQFSYENLLKTFFNQVQVQNELKNEMDLSINFSNLQINSTESFGKKNRNTSQRKKVNEENSEILFNIESGNKNLKSANSIKIDLDSIGINLVSNFQEDIPDNLSNLSYEKNNFNSNLSSEKEKDDVNSFDDLKINNIAADMDDLNKSGLSYGDKKSIFTEFFQNQNTNRLQKFFNKNFSYKQINDNKKFFIHNKIGRSPEYQFNTDEQPNIPQYVTYNNFYNNPTPIAKITDQCKECIFPSSNTNFIRSKKCLGCQKCQSQSRIKNNKTSRSYYFTSNSYKAGKMNQICSSCKNIFVVPVALSKQRKTCYYCFKANKSETTTVN